MPGPNKIPCGLVKIVFRLVIFKHGYTKKYDLVFIQASSLEKKLSKTTGASFTYKDELNQYKALINDYIKICHLIIHPCHDFNLS